MKRSNIKRRLQSTIEFVIEVLKDKDNLVTKTEEEFLVNIYNNSQRIIKNFNINNKFVKVGTNGKH